MDNFCIMKQNKNVEYKTIQSILSQIDMNSDWIPIFLAQ